MRTGNGQEGPEEKQRSVFRDFWGPPLKSGRGERLKQEALNLLRRELSIFFRQED